MVLIFFVAVTALLLTQKLASLNRIGVIRSSCLVTLIGAALCFLFAGENSLYLKVVFGASFIGMTTLEFLQSKVSILLSAVVFTFLFTYFYPLLPFQGGALGLSAFLCVLITRYVMEITNYLRKDILELSLIHI